MGDQSEDALQNAPASPAEAPHHVRLCALPGGDRFPESRTARLRELDSPLASIVAGAPPDPTLSLERPQRSGERRAIEHENSAEASLGDGSDPHEHLEQRELGDRQPAVAQLVVVELRDRPRGAAQIRACARENWQGFYPLASVRRPSWCASHFQPFADDVLSAR
jgi:hypothetical protein